MEVTFKVRVIIGSVIFVIIFWVAGLLNLPLKMKLIISVILGIIAAISIKDDVQRVKQVK